MKTCALIAAMSLIFFQSSCGGSGAPADRAGGDAIQPISAQGGSSAAPSHDTGTAPVAGEKNSTVTDATSKVEVGVSEPAPWPFPKSREWFIAEAQRSLSPTAFDPTLTLVSVNGSTVSVELWARGSRDPGVRSDYIQKILFDGKSGAITKTIYGN